MNDITTLARSLVTSKAWIDMDDDEHQLCIQTLVAAVESEEQLHEAFRSIEVSCSIIWDAFDPGDKSPEEMKVIVTSLKLLKSKNGVWVKVQLLSAMG